MSAIAPRVHTDRAILDRLKQLQRAFDAELKVELSLHDGTVLTGTIPERPTIQQFRDQQGNEGTNGLLQIDTARHGMQTVWLDQVDHFIRQGSN